MGAKAAPKKCFTFSTDSTQRTWMRTHIWKHINSQIAVKLNFRDLGSHVNISNGINGATLTQRMLDILPMLGQIAWLPHETKQKILFTLNAAFTKGFYGCESTHVNETVLNQVASAVARIVGNAGNTRNKELLFALFGEKLDPDPVLYIFRRRIMLLRRMHVKHQDYHVMLQEILQAYHNVKYPGTLHDQTVLENLLIAPPVGGANRQC